MKIRINRTSIVKYASALYFLFIFLNDHTIYSDFFEQTGTIFLVAATFFLITSALVAGKLYSNGKMWLIFVGWAVCVLLPCIISGFRTLVIIRFCYWITLLLMLLVLETVSIDYRESLLITVKILCVWCFVCYFYTMLGLDFLPVTNVSDKLLYNWYKVELNGYLIYKNLVEFSMGAFSLIKLYSPLGEPGIASMYFNFAVIWLLFFTDLSDKRNTRWIAAFSAAVVLSLSLMGVLVLIATFVVYMIQKRKFGAIILLSIPAVVLCVVMILQKLGSESYSQRSNDYVVMFEAIAGSLPFGIGLGNIDLVHTASQNRELQGFYCGLLYPLMQFGIFGLYYYFMMVIAAKYFSDNHYGRYAFFIYFIMTLLTQPQADECFILSFIFAGVIHSCRYGKRRSSFRKPYEA